MYFSIGARVDTKHLKILLSTRTTQTAVNTYIIWIVIKTKLLKILTQDIHF